MEPVIGLHKGGRFDFRTPGPDGVNIEVVAHALSQICRFTGHTDEFYSVAQHAVYTARLVERMGYPQYALWGLFHDNPEAVYGDHSSPLKAYLNARTDGVYRQVIEEIDKQVLLHFADVLENTDFCHYTDECKKVVKAADYEILYLERNELMPDSKYLYPDFNDPRFSPISTVQTLRELDPNFEPWSPKRARYVFVKEFERICKQKPGKAPMSA